MHGVDDLCGTFSLFIFYLFIYLFIYFFVILNKDCQLKSDDVGAKFSNNLYMNRYCSTSVICVILFCLSVTKNISLFDFVMMITLVFF